MTDARTDRTACDVAERQLVAASVVEHLPALFAAALHYCGDSDEAELLVRSAIEDAHRRRADLPGPDRCRVWLLGLMTQRWLAGRRPIYWLAWWRCVTSGFAAQGASAAPDGTSDAAAAALQSLPPTVAIPLYLCDVQALSYAEIAVVTEMCEQRVARLVRLGRRTLRRQMMATEGAGTTHS